MDRHTTTGRLLRLAAIRKVHHGAAWDNTKLAAKKGNRIMRARRWHAWILGSLMALGVSAVPAAADVVGGFGGPLFGLATASNGDLLVADAGSGILAIRRGQVGKTIEIPGVTDVSPIGSGMMWAVTGAMGAPPQGPQSDTGQGLHRVSRGKQKKVANLFAFEALYNPHNPDGQSPPDSHPFDVQSLGPNAALVVDAGGNDLLWVNKHGEVNVLAVFPNELVSTANLKQLAGCPSPSPFCGFPDSMLAQAVPTSIAVDGHGYIYVGELKGFPAPTGKSNI